MNGSRFFLIAGMILLSSLSVFAKKKIYLDAKGKLPESSVEAFIDAASKELTLELDEDLGDAYISVTDLSGKVICEKRIGSNGVYVLPLPLLGKSEYILYVSFENIYLQGSFDLK